MTKTESILNLEMDATNELVEQALLNVCIKNKKLTKFIKKIFLNNKNKEICAWEDYGWEWDIECYGKGEGAEFAICNHDLRYDKYSLDEDSVGDDGWEMEMVPDVFANYLHNFNWSDITLDNGKYLFLLENEDYLFFQIFDKENMEDGKVDWHGINW